MIHNSDEPPAMIFNQLGAKELLIYFELTPSEIAYKLHYSSVPDLSSQLKKVTGLAPSFF